MYRRLVSPCPCDPFTKDLLSARHLPERPPGDSQTDNLSFRGGGPFHFTGL
jgi:hypothetical protein